MNILFFSYRLTLKILDKISSSEDESDSDLDHEISSEDEENDESFFKVCRKNPLKPKWKILNQNKQSQKNFTPRLLSKKRKIYSKFSFDLDKFKKA